MNTQTLTAYPLCWPVGWKRTPYPQKSNYGDFSIAHARDFVQQQVRLMGGENLIISSNLVLRDDGLPRSGQRQPQDKAVAVYFMYHGKQMCFACDKWATVEDNIRAIGKTIDAIRAIERAGSSDLMERAFTGFAALPAPASEQWWVVLGVSQNADYDTVKATYRKLAMQHHPDTGGNVDEFQRVQMAYEQAKQALGKG
jgi:hypothetical protein